MNGHHKTILIFIVYFDSFYAGLGKKAGIISDHIATSLFVKIKQIAAFDNIYTVDRLGKVLMLCGFLTGLIC